MDDIFTNIRNRFVNGTVLDKLLLLNIGAFLLIRLVNLVCILFGWNDYSSMQHIFSDGRISEEAIDAGGFYFMQYIQLPADFTRLLFRPWTLVSYMFAHFDVMHILFNMLWLYWFGKLFMTFFNERQLGSLYVMGGLAGALLFMLSYNLFPYFEPLVSTSSLIGASAAVMAIVFAVSFYQKDYEIGIFLIGRVKLIYLALFTLLIDIFAITSSNAGGHIAHIGGALLGIWFASQMHKGKDITSPISRVIDKMVNLGKRKPKMHVSYKRPETDYEYNARKHQETVEIDAILDKLKQSGYASLSSEEKKKLFEASKK